MVGDSNDEANFPQKLLLTKRQALKLLKAFENIFSPNIKLSKTQLFRLVQSGEPFGRLFAPLIKSILLLIKMLLNNYLKVI